MSGNLHSRKKEPLRLSFYNGLLDTRLTELSDSCLNANRPLNKSIRWVCILTSWNRMTYLIKNTPPTHHQFIELDP